MMKNEEAEGKGKFIDKMSPCLIQFPSQSQILDINPLTEKRPTEPQQLYIAVIPKSFSKRTKQNT